VRLAQMLVHKAGRAEELQTVGALKLSLIHLPRASSGHACSAAVKRFPLYIWFFWLVEAAPVEKVLQTVIAVLKPIGFLLFPLWIHDFSVRENVSDNHCSTTTMEIPLVVTPQRGVETEVMHMTEIRHLKVQLRFWRRWCGIEQLLGDVSWDT